MKKPEKTTSMRFQSKLINIAEGMEYYAILVPPAITRRLGTHGPVPVSAQVNGSERFVASFHPLGDGQHRLRVRNKICKSVGLKAGDPVKVEFQVRDREKEVTIPDDLAVALRVDKATRDFDDLPVGKKAFLLRWLDQAAKRETRARRIRKLVEEAHKRREIKS